MSRLQIFLEIEWFDAFTDQYRSVISENPDDNERLKVFLKIEKLFQSRVELIVNVNDEAELAKQYKNNPLLKKIRKMESESQVWFKFKENFDNWKQSQLKGNELLLVDSNTENKDMTSNFPGLCLDSHNIAAQFKPLFFNIRKDKDTGNYVKSEDTFKSICNQIKKAFNATEPCSFIIHDGYVLKNKEKLFDKLCNDILPKKKTSIVSLGVNGKAIKSLESEYNELTKMKENLKFQLFETDKLHKRFVASIFYFMQFDKSITSFYDRKGTDELRAISIYDPKEDHHSDAGWELLYNRIREFKDEYFGKKKLRSVFPTFLGKDLPDNEVLNLVK